MNWTLQEPNSNAGGANVARTTDSGLKEECRRLRLGVKRMECFAGEYLTLMPMVRLRGSTHHLGILLTNTSDPAAVVDFRRKGTFPKTTYADRVPQQRMILVSDAAVWG